ncbi:MAG TPA: phosphoribosylaminoimidazolesuccinocarboxamide synthase [Candidatus Nanoarchaeia archaeon]|nr:phosphoribosylaminoimidazolesuccinocarboxamide synthase [Candidatus Nanoarchaeia archaeon]
MISDAVIRNQINNALESIGLEIGKRIEGKVRDSFVLDGKRVIVTTDRISAFDRVLTTIPFKGQVLNQTSAFWFDKTKRIVPNHVIEVPDPNVMVVKECKQYPVEVVVRGYITGVTTTSLWYNYSRGVRMYCGVKLPEGLKKDQKLDAPIITPTTKALHGAHDLLISKEEILSQGLVSKDEYEKIEEYAYKLFEFGQREAAKNGLILVDTKYEFGKSDGEIMVIDEVHTPDSSRFWFSKNYGELFSKGIDQQSFDKEYVRRYLAERGFIGEGKIPPIPDDVKVEAAKRYITAYETITGQNFVADNSNVAERIKKNLRRYL